MKIRMLAVSGAALVALLGSAGAAAAATSTPYDTDAHHAAVVQLAAADDDPGTLGTGNDPAGQQQNPQMQQQVPADQIPTQINNVQTQSGGGVALSATAVGALVCGFLIFFWTKKGGLSKGHAVGCVVFGVLLAPTFVGPLVGQLMGSGAQTFGNLWSGLG